MLSVYTTKFTQGCWEFFVQYVRKYIYIYDIRQIENSKSCQLFSVTFPHSLVLIALNLFPAAICLCSQGHTKHSACTSWPNPITWCLRLHAKGLFFSLTFVTSDPGSTVVCRVYSMKYACSFVVLLLLLFAIVLSVLYSVAPWRCACNLNTLRPRQNDRRFADDTFKRIFLNENDRISIKISLKFVPKGPINNIPALV